MRVADCNIHKHLIYVYIQNTLVFRNNDTFTFFRSDKALGDFNACNEFDE